MGTLHCLTLVMTLAAAPAGPAPAKAKPSPAAAKTKKIAVLPFDVQKGVDPSLGKTLAGALLGEVRKQRGRDVNLMAPADVVQALPAPLRGRLKRCEMAACKAQMAQAVSADQALGGNLGLLGNTWVLNVALLESKDGAQVAQWTGKAPEKQMDKLLDQLPEAVKALFPPPAPKPVAAASPPPPAVNPPAVLPDAVRPADASPPVAATQPPGPAPEAAPILPADQAPPPLTEQPPSSSEVITAVTDPDQPYVRAVAQDAVKPGPSWNKGLLAGGVALILPGVALGVLGVLGAVASVTGSITAAISARNINQEVHALPHKETGAFPLSRLILVGRILEVLGYAGFGVAAVAALLGLGALVAGLAGGISLLVVAAPKESETKVLPVGGVSQ